MRMLKLVQEYEDDRNFTMVKFQHKELSTALQDKNSTVQESKGINESLPRNITDNPITTECAQEKEMTQSKSPSNPLCKTPNREPKEETETSIKLCDQSAKSLDEENKLLFLSPSYIGECTPQAQGVDKGFESQPEVLASYIPNTISMSSETIDRTSEANMLSSESVAQQVDLFKWCDETNQFEFLNPPEKAKLDDKHHVQGNDTLCVHACF